VKPLHLDRIELTLLLEAIYQRYGYDFRAYALASIERRVRQFLISTDCKAISELIPLVLHDADFFSRLLGYFSIPVTELFRDPFVYKAVREKVITLLHTWPHIKIWHAGCASGEEVYSLAILLKEEGLYNRATIYATDFNAEALERAREGIYDIAKLQEATRNYQQADGRRSFSEYYHASYQVVTMVDELKERIVFSTHNLATDSVFGEMHLVFCRNVLIYFNRELQNRALGLFTDSLVSGGFLCLGTKEDIQFTAASEDYTVIDRNARLFKKKVAI
jgi:chemotaxis protein methyltransferase CheR